MTHAPTAHTEPARMAPQVVRAILRRDPHPLPPWEDGEAPCRCVSRPHRHLSLWGDEIATSNIDVVRAAMEANAPVAVLPVYGYSHSGVAISTEPFGCQWDSWLAGYVYLTQADLDETHGTAAGSGGADQPHAEPNTPAARAARTSAEGVLRAAVALWDQYIQGGVWCVHALGADGQRVDALYGLYGDEAEAALVAADTWGLDPGCVTVAE